MALSFPNASRSYDARRDVVRFWGHDSAMEIAFFVEADVFSQARDSTGDVGDEATVLLAFDADRERIHAAARKAYARTHKNTYVLTSTDF
ncbi:MAG: DUF1488 domain-containing protein [Alphaproteobacteria bacterium]